MEKEQNVKEKLLEAGKREFLKQGYEKASLRKICKNAGVTTGALYFFFKNKEDLFNKIVGVTASDLKSLVAKFTEAEINGKCTSEESERSFLFFIFERKDEVRILLEKARGSIFENYYHDLCELISSGYLQFFYKYGGETKDEEIARIIAKMRIEGHLSLINGNYDLETALKYSKLLSVYGDNGFINMMKQYKNAN